MADEWARLVKRYADGRAICNCGNAYYSEGGTYWRGNKEYHDGQYCKYGCQANQYNLKDEIARRVLQELGEELQNG